jgi:CRISPR/Cas system CSM-associated protein Csm4 (group 5 of RAMP superfamily)
MGGPSAPSVRVFETEALETEDPRDGVIQRCRALADLTAGLGTERTYGTGLVNKVKEYPRVCLLKDKEARRC